MNAEKQTLEKQNIDGSEQHLHDEKEFTKLETAQQEVQRTFAEVPDNKHEKGLMEDNLAVLAKQFERTKREKKGIIHALRANRDPNPPQRLFQKAEQAIAYVYSTEMRRTKLKIQFKSIDNFLYSPEHRAFAQAVEKLEELRDQELQVLDSRIAGLMEKKKADDKRKKDLEQANAIRKALGIGKVEVANDFTPAPDAQAKLIELAEKDVDERLERYYAVNKRWSFRDIESDIRLLGSIHRRRLLLKNSEIIELKEKLAGEKQGKVSKRTTSFFNEGKTRELYNSAALTWKKVDKFLRYSSDAKEYGQLVTSIKELQKLRNEELSLKDVEIKDLRQQIEDDAKAGDNDKRYIMDKKEAA